MINVGVFGSTGRVGRLLIEQLLNDRETKLASVFVRKSLDFHLPGQTLVTNDMETFLESCDLVIDFSLPGATEALLTQAVESGGKPMVIGTTGLNPHQQNLLKEAAKAMPVFYATNMSMGVAMLNQLVYTASKALRDFDIEIVEMHHRHKKDAPSGTALTLAEHAAKGRDVDLNRVRVSGRDGAIGERKPDEIAVMALRGGDVVGEHTVGFYADGEYIRLSHTATQRSTFAIGAIKAGKWLINQPNGLYAMQDFLQI